ncbi:MULTISPECIES: hypothetical protein [Pseudoalteromonas]|uniref:Uncharacterized protein n=1 Tax=Pseudoalteromonas luteoviolacea (strain 2ta16) TaxID=1353533 RepID=V4HP59_PSEL2|nr:MULTISPECIES: hypothetical protein [Pseudoalteromonas]ESP91568.1 hypothetical protein PL2TA16_00120 [Pseudoalteromonas luteoviolacea 2ta16]KZN39182.1 hypothetical protein N483_19375 [Pseudoalteromonas luteoviolacea NCIMB 1944]MCG7551094.1 hypothetical protein [Pseudoalteromonas sp. Of7M-16]
MILSLKTKKLKTLSNKEVIGNQLTKQIGGGNTDTVTRPDTRPDCLIGR